MTEETSQESSPAAVDAEPPTPTEGESAPVKDETPAEAPAVVNEDGDEEEGLDPQLVVLCVVLWIVAMGIFGANWTSLKINWYLGNVKETLGPMPLPGSPEEQLPLSVDDAAIAKLVEMAGDTPVVEALERELTNRMQSDQRYRVLMIVTAEKIPGDAAFNLLARAAVDYDYRVRINCYRALTARGLVGSPEDKEAAFGVVLTALNTDPNPVGRLLAANQLSEFKDMRAAWPLIRTLRDADGEYRGDLRAACVLSLRAISGNSEADLPTDVALEGDAFDAQVQAWEDWFTGQGGEIPAGESLKDVRRAQEASQPKGEDAPAGPPDDETKSNSSEDAQ